MRRKQQVSCKCFYEWWRANGKVKLQKSNLPREKNIEKAVENKYPYYMITLSTVRRFETTLSELVTQII